MERRHQKSSRETAKVCKAAVHTIAAFDKKQIWIQNQIPEDWSTGIIKI